MSDNQNFPDEVKASGSVNHNDVKTLISVPADTPKVSASNEQQYLPCFIGFFIIFTVTYVASSWVRKQIDKIIEVKGIRLTFTVVVLPFLGVIISDYFINENKKFIYLLVLIISIVTSERSTVLTVEKKCKTKDEEIDVVNARAEKLNGIILSKISEFKKIHLSRLMNIANDKNNLSADDVRGQVFEYTQFMMFESTFLYTIDELEYKTNNELSSGDDKTLASYNGVMS